MYYLNSRYYNPEIGRFINADGLIGPVGSILTHNMYAYCGNNPVMNIDPDGEFFVSFLVVGALVGVAIGGTTSIVSQGLDKGWDNINWWQVGLDATMGGIGGLVATSGIGALGAGAIMPLVQFLKEVCKVYLIFMVNNLLIL